MDADLDDQVIAAVVSEQFQNRYPRLIGRNARLPHHGRGPLSTFLTIETAAGVQGWGPAGGSTDGLDRFVGRRVGDLFAPEVGLIDATAVTLDLALHDLAGQTLGLPVHRLLGSLGPEQTFVYDGGIYFSDLDRPDLDRPDLERVDPGSVGAVLADCADDAGDGFTAFKLKIGRGHRWTGHEQGMARDIAVTRAVRQAYPDAVLLVDANDGYTLADTLRYLESTQACDLFWIEEPFVENRAELTELRRWRDAAGSSILLADGETAPDVTELLRLAADGLIDVLLMDVIGFGFSAWRQLMPRLRELGLRSSPHTWGELSKTFAAAQLARGLGNVIAIEGVPGSVQGLDAAGYRFDGGTLAASEAAGLGLRRTAATTGGTGWGDLLR